MALHQITVGVCTECGRPSLVEDHGHLRCTNPECPKADLIGFADTGTERPQRG